MLVGTKRPKILHVGKYYPPYRGGIESHLETLCTGLSEYLDVEVVVASGSGETLRESPNGIPVTRLASRCAIRSQSITPSLIEFIAKNDADIVHLHLPNPWAAVAYLLSRSNSPLVITHHSDIVRQRVLKLAYAPVERVLARKCSAFIATSQSAVDFSPVLHEHRGKCAVVPLGVAQESFLEPDQTELDRVRAEYDGPLVLSVGRLVYYKGLEYLILAMKHVPAKLLIIGTGPLEHSLRALIRDEALTGKVILLRDISPERLRALYHAAHVFVLPSIVKSEAFGIVQIEAMAAGCPVINTDLPSGVPFVSKHGESGITVPPRDSNAIAGAINALLSDGALRAAYAQGARARAARLFTAVNMVEQTLDVYRTVLSPAGKFAEDSGQLVELNLPLRADVQAIE